MSIKQDLMEVKGQLVTLINKKPLHVCDYEQLEYLIQYVDWLLLDDLHIDKQTITTLMDEIVTTAVHSLDLDVLDTLTFLNKIEKDIYAKV